MAELPPDFADLLVELLEARATKDLDIWICPGPEDADRVIRALRRFGAPLASMGVTRDDFLAGGQTVQIGVPPLRIDLLTEIAGVDFEAAWTAREMFSMGDHEVPIIGAPIF